jgi:glutathione S-transferase
VSLVPVDMGALEHKGDTVAARNPLKRLPVLELDDGTVITETIAICRYFEELHPTPALFGAGALGKALVEMWQRRLELNFLMPVANAFRHIHPAMKEWEIPQMPEWGEINKPKAVEFMAILDRELASREFAAGDAYSVADITGLVTMDFLKPARVAVPEEFANLRRWHAAIAARPSAAA